MHLLRLVAFGAGLALLAAPHGFAEEQPEAGPGSAAGAAAGSAAGAGAGTAPAADVEAELEPRAERPAAPHDRDQRMAPAGAPDQGVQQEVEERLREAGVARPPEQDERQLRDLNLLSRELAPGTPVPAPQAEVDERRR